MLICKKQEECKYFENAERCYDKCSRYLGARNPFANDNYFTDPKPCTCGGKAEMLFWTDKGMVYLQVKCMKCGRHTDVVTISNKGEMLEVWNGQN